MVFDSTQLFVFICFILSNLVTWRLATRIARKQNHLKAEANKRRKLKDLEKNTLGRIRREFSRLTKLRQDEAGLSVYDNASCMRVVASDGQVLCTVTCSASNKSLTVLNHPGQDIRVFPIEALDAVVQFAVFGN